MSNVTIFTDQTLPKPALSLLDQALQMPTLRSSLPLLQRLRSPVFSFFNPGEVDGGVGVVQVEVDLEVHAEEKLSTRCQHCSCAS